MQLRKVTFKVDIPADCESEPDRRFDLAIAQAREEAEDWVIPANWVLVSDDGHTVVVARYSKL